MPRPYESVIIFDSSLDESQVEERIERYRKVLVGDGDAPFSTDLWGKRKLAYPIQKKEQGIYAVLRYDSEPDALTEFERLARLDELVLRQLTVVNPVEAPPEPERAARESSGEEE